MLYPFEKYNECECESGNVKYPLYDGHGIFLSYACEACEKEVLEQFRNDVMEPYEADEPIDEE